MEIIIIMATAKSTSSSTEAPETRETTQVTSKAVAPKPLAAKKTKVAAVGKKVVAKRPPQVDASIAPKAKATPSKPHAKKAVDVQATPAHVPKPVKDKLVRDSFTMPRSDFDLIGRLKDKALGFQRPTKKSELLRAGLHVLAGLSDAKLKAALEALVPLKAGRPPREGR